jgi:alpha,alpha-trehalase
MNEKHLDTKQTHAVIEYIHNTWPVLRRTEEYLLQLLIDPKLPYRPEEKRILYISRRENIKQITKKLDPYISPRLRHTFETRHLPRSQSHIQTHGLLYLPNPYLVPGGRFNEMYGWDSYYIILGLIEASHIKWAKEMVDNLLYEVDHYGKVLNANRSYYLTRSHPPCLAQSVLMLYEKINDKAWLKNALPSILKFYDFWIKPPHLVKKTNLSRYYTTAATQAPEVSNVYYEAVKGYYRTQKIYDYDVNKYYHTQSNELTPAFYHSDRAIRESGFDLTNQHGPFGANITQCVSVSLNCLLYQMEQDIAEIYKILKKPSQEKKWRNKSQTRADLINQYMWDHATGYYFSYNFKQNTIRPYIFATTFYPLFVGVAKPAQAERIVNNLPIFETAGGILTSAYNTGMQWDAPFGWAPFQHIAIHGLRRYGYKEHAKRIGIKFLNLVNITFEKYKTIFEKFDVRACDTLSHESICYGYKTNEIGFGWTNAVYMNFLKTFKLHIQKSHKK